MTGDAYDHILVPTDGSDLALRALEEALTLAALTDATIDVLYVVDEGKIAELATDPGVEETTFDGDLRELFERYESAGDRAVAELEREAHERGVDVVTAVRRGIPHEEIVAYADENDVDLVVMGTHGRRGVRRYLLGSTTERVLRRSRVPVLAVRGGDGDRHDADGASTGR